MAYFVRISVHVFNVNPRVPLSSRRRCNFNEILFFLYSIIRCRNGVLCGIKWKRVNGKFNIKRLVHLPVCQLLPGLCQLFRTTTGYEVDVNTKYIEYGNECNARGTGHEILLGRSWDPDAG